MTTYNIAIGSDCSGNNPADGQISRFQISDVALTQAQVTRYNARSTVPRMSEAAVLFADLISASDIYYRPKVDIRAVPAPLLSSYAALGVAMADPNTNISLQPVQLAVYQETQADLKFNETFFLDNIELEVSGIRWEFSPDNGITWYSMKDIMNESMSRFVFPNPTTTVNVRATSNGLNDWLQSYLVNPFYE